MNDQINNVKNLISNYTIETTPNVYSKIGVLSNLLLPKTHVYITYLPDEDINNIYITAKKIKEEGLIPIPHLPARTIENYKSLEKYMGNLAEEYGVKNILIIGGSGNQKGNISSSVEILKTGLIDKFKFTNVGLAGHPDGNPDITKIELDKAIIEKNKIAENTNAKLYIVTQFFFNVSSFIDWENHLKSLNNKLEIHAGIPGPANLKTLIGFAKSCGVGNSIKFLTKQAFNVTKIATTNVPDKLIYDLSSYKSLNSDSNLKKIHFYPFGGMKRTSGWANALINNQLSIDTNGKITINNFNF